MFRLVSPKVLNKRMRSGASDCVVEAIASIQKDCSRWRLLGPLDIMSNEISRCSCVPQGQKCICLTDKVFHFLPPMQQLQSCAFSACKFDTCVCNYCCLLFVCFVFSNWIRCMNLLAVRVMTVVTVSTTHTKCRCCCSWSLQLWMDHFQCSRCFSQTKDVSATLCGYIWKCMSNNFWCCLVGDCLRGESLLKHLTEFYASSVWSIFGPLS